MTYPCTGLNGACDEKGPSPPTSTPATLLQVISTDGGAHDMAIIDNSGRFQNSIFSATDGSGFTPVVAAGSAATLIGPIRSVVGPTGISYSPVMLNNGNGGQARGFNLVDTSGNTVTVNANGWVDSVGRTFSGSYFGPGGGTLSQTPMASQDDPIPGVKTTDLSQCSSGSTDARTWSVPGSGNATDTYTFCYIDQTASTAFGTYSDGATTFVDDGEETRTWRLLSQIILPNSTEYRFSYDNYLELTSMTLPSGGSIQYHWTTYQWGPGSQSPLTRGISSRTVFNTDGSSSQWLYAQSSASSASCGQKIVATDPSKNDTVYDWQFAASIFVCQRIIRSYQGSSTAGTLIKTITNSYFQNGSEFVFPGPNGPQATLGPISSSVTTWAANNLTSETDYTYTAPQGSFPSYNYAQNTSPAGGVPFPLLGNFGNRYQRLQSVTSYDYGPGAHGSLINEVTTQYQWQNNPAYVTANLLNLPSSVIVTNSQGNRAAETDYTYDESGFISGSGTFGDLTTTSRWLNTGGSIASHTSYDGNGMPIKTLDPKGNAATFTYQCSDSLPLNVTNALGQATTYGYDCNSGLMNSIQDPNDAAAGRSGTRFFYNSSRDLTDVTYPDGGSTTTNYNNYAVPLTVTTTAAASPDPSMVSSTSYDGFGRVIKSIAANGAVTDTTYDGVGNVKSVSNPHFSSSNPSDGTTTFTYDALGRTTVQTQPDGSTLQWSYLGNVTTSTDEAGHAWKRTSDALGRLTNVVEPTGASTDYSYNALGDLLGVNQNGVTGETPRIRSFVYDSLSRLTSSTNPETGTIGYGYDANGNMKSKTDARGIIVTYSYDALNRLTEKTYSDGVTLPVLYGYDASSAVVGANHVTMSNGVGRLSWFCVSAPTSCPSMTAYSYDALGRVAQTLSVAPSNQATGAGYSLNFGYDLAGNMTSLTYPDGRLIKQTWDGGGHLSSIADGNGNQYLEQQGTTYWPNGSSEAISFGNGVISGVRLNNRLQPWVWTAARIDANPPGNSALYLKEACYGPVTAAPELSLLPCPGFSAGNSGNIWQIIDGLVAGNTQSFIYDNLNRLTSFEQADGTIHQTYKYDSFGNLNQNAGTLQSNLGFNANNQISSGGYGYDAAGNINSTFNGISNIPYTYDAENKLTNVNSGEAIYTYDGEGNRVRKDVGSAWQEYVQFNGQPVAEKNDDGTWSDYIFANGQRLARVDNYDIRIHMSGTNCSGTGCAGTYEAHTTLSSPSDIIQAGDLLTWRQYQDGSAVGGLVVEFSDNSVANQMLKDGEGQFIDADTTINTWHERVVDLSPFGGRGLTIINFHPWISSSSGPGNWDEYFGDIVLVHANGTSTTLYSRSLTAIPGSSASSVSNLSVITEKVLATGNIPDPTTSFNTTFYHNDQVGSAILLTDSGGWPVSSSTYYPFGQEQAPQFVPPSGTGNHYRFTGKERDTESGLDYFGARYMSSSMGRFMSPDWNSDPDAVPFADLSNPQSLNLYGYVQNNPLTNTDPDGHEKCQDGSEADVCVTANPIGGVDLLNLAGPAQLAMQVYQTTANILQQLTNVINTPGGPGCLGNAMLAGGLTGAATGGSTGGLVGVAAGGVGEVVTAPGGALIGSGIGAAGAGIAAMSSCGGGGGSNKTSHGQERADEAASGDTHRQVGDANKVIREGRKFTDADTGNTVHVSGNRVVITNSQGQQVTQFTNSSANTQARIQAGRWIPQ